MTRIYQERASKRDLMNAVASDVQLPTKDVLEQDLLLSEAVWRREYKGPSEILKPVNLRFMRPLSSKIKTVTFRSLVYAISRLKLFSASTEIFPAMDSSENLVIYMNIRKSLAC